MPNNLAFHRTAGSQVDSVRFVHVGGWVIECEMAAELFARVEDGSP